MPYPERGTPESFVHFRGLYEATRYLRMDELEDRCVYLIHARNSYIGIWQADKRAFVIVRRKFEDMYLFPEYHWDTGAPHGTAKPFLKIGERVEDERAREALDEAHRKISYADFMGRTRQFIDNPESGSVTQPPEGQG